MSRYYAQGTTVPVERSRMEIDSLLTRHGASSVAILNDEDHFQAAFAFTLRGARFRVELPLPKREEVIPKKGSEPSGWGRMREEQQTAWVDTRLQQARKERWRAMLLLLKSKLEIVRLELSTFEHEFLADMVLPTGETAYVELTNALRKGLSSADLPKLLGGEKS